MSGHDRLRFFIYDQNVSIINKGTSKCSYKCNSTSLILSLLHFCYVFPLVKVEIKHHSGPNTARKNVYTAGEKWQKAPLLLKLGLLCTKPFSSSRCPVKIETKSFFSLLECDYSQGAAQCFLEHEAEAEAAQRQRKKNEHTN